MGLFKRNPNKEEGRRGRGLEDTIVLVVGIVASIAMAITIISSQYNLRKKFEKSDVDYSLSGYTEKGGKVTGAFNKAFDQGRITVQDLYFVHGKINDAGGWLTRARQFFNRQKLDKAFDCVINANSEIDKGNQRFKGRPELQKYFEPARAAVLKVRKELNEYRKLVK
ncbi:MAG TPA: hypothetical protein HA282_05630 [Nanoarchaeota archaeon]|nr:hypothetical protein [Nanoarchaeota archaeon]HIH51765.1 hypothetical protein [Nanoarchaeota archaeon]HIH66663.1 hypothetical protein [Nanoarchaeota archaeon]